MTGSGTVYGLNISAVHIILADSLSVSDNIPPECAIERLKGIFDGDDTTHSFVHPISLERWFSALTWSKLASTQIRRTILGAGGSAMSRNLTCVTPSQPPETGRVTMRLYGVMSSLASQAAKDSSSPQRLVEGASQQPPPPPRALGRGAGPPTPVQFKRDWSSSLRQVLKASGLGPGGFGLSELYILFGRVGISRRLTKLLDKAA